MRGMRTGLLGAGMAVCALAGVLARGATLEPVLAASAECTDGSL